MRQTEAHVIADLARGMAAARTHNLCFSAGGALAAAHSVQQEHVELLNPIVDGKPIVSMARVSSVNITLVHSETLAQDVRPARECDFFYMNLALGGRP